MAAQYPFKRVPAVGEAVDPLDLVALMLEGNYSDWILKSTITTGDTFHLITDRSYFTLDEIFAMIVDDDGKVLQIDVIAGTYTDLDATIGHMGDLSAASHSIRGKYFLAQTGGYSNVTYIYKDGVLVKEILSSGVDTHAQIGCIISHTGKYVIIYQVDTSQPLGQQDRYQIWEGS